MIGADLLSCCHLFFSDAGRTRNGVKRTRPITFASLLESISPKLEAVFGEKKRGTNAPNVPTL